MTLAQYKARKQSKHISYGPSDDGCRWVEHPDDGLRRVGKAHDLARIDHTGWFMNEFQDETAWGVVYLLPHGRFVPGTEDSYDTDGVRLDFSDIHYAACDAARAADTLAERLAEVEREYQRVETAKMRIEDIGQEIKDHRAAVLELCRGIRASVMADSVCVAIRKVIRQYRREVRELYREREALRGEI